MPVDSRRSRLFHAVVLVGCAMGAACGTEQDLNNEPVEANDDDDDGWIPIHDNSDGHHDDGGVPHHDAGEFHAHDAGVDGGHAHDADAGNHLHGIVMTDSGWYPTK